MKLFSNRTTKLCLNTSLFEGVHRSLFKVLIRARTAPLCKSTNVWLFLVVLDCALHGALSLQKYIEAVYSSEELSIQDALVILELLGL